MDADALGSSKGRDTRAFRHRGPLTTIGHFLRIYPLRTASVIGALLLAGLAEGVGIAALLPIISIAVDGSTSNDGALQQMLESGLGYLALQPSLGLLFTLVALAVIIKALVTLAATSLVGFTAAQISTDLRLSLLRALLCARWDFFASHQIGTTANAVATEAQRAAEAYFLSCTTLSFLIQTVVYVCVALIISWKISIAGVVIGLLLVVSFRRLVWQARQWGAEQTRLLKTLSARVTDALRGVKALKAMALEEKFANFLEGETKELKTTLQRLVLNREILRLSQEPITVTFLAVGMYMVLTVGGMSLASTLVLGFLFTRIVGRITQVQREYQGFVVGESAFWSMQSAIDLAATAREVSMGNVQPILSKNIELRNLNFRYAEHPVITNLSVCLPALNFIAIVGPSGAGKTTLLDLIVGLHPEIAHCILIDGIPLNTIDMKEWRCNIGYVPQDLFLFNSSILENLTLGDATIKREEAKQALIDAGAWKFVSSLSNGIDTQVGEAGAKLSGGERQRIALARALTRRPTLLLLDEATSALDQSTEAALCRTLRKLTHDMTILAITHRPTIRDFADITFDMKDGGLHAGTVAAVQAARN